MSNIRIDLTGLYKKFDNAIAAINEGANVGLNYALDGVENNVKKRIAMSGTDGSAKRYSGQYGVFAGPGRSGTGRIDTGLMYDSIVRSVSAGKNNISGEIGWPQDRPKYFDLQEKGFDYKHNSYPISGEDHHVEGMFAWRDAQSLLSKTAPGLIGSWVKEYVRRAAK